MNTPMDDQQPRTVEKQQSRIGVALLGAALMIGIVVFAVYRLRATPPSTASHNSAAILGSMRETPGNAHYRTVISAFVEALQRDDDAAMRSVYPTMTESDTRILHEVRKRLGGTSLHVTAFKLEDVADTVVHAQFIIAADGSAEPAQLPFNATLSQRKGAWRIADLH